VLFSRQPTIAAEAARLGAPLLDLLAREQAQLASAVPELPPVLTRDYDAAREMRLLIWRALLSSPAMLPALLAASAPESLIIIGALPHARPMRASSRVPPSFLPHEGSLALRLEGVEMLAVLLDSLRGRWAGGGTGGGGAGSSGGSYTGGVGACSGGGYTGEGALLHTEKGAFAPLAEQLFAAFRRHAVVPTEVARLRSREHASALRASAGVILLLLDRAADARAWQLLDKACVSATMFEIYEQTRAQPAGVQNLVTGGHTMRRPLARVAATFVHGVFEYERETLRAHPLLSSDMRARFAASVP
jgi:hypothetical protein